MPVEEIIRQIMEQRKIIRDAQARQDELEDALIAAKDKEWDQISVKMASEKSGLSQPTIYRFINEGKLVNITHKGSLKYISNSELEKLDC